MLNVEYCTVARHVTTEERVRPSSDADNGHHIRRDASRSTKEVQLSVPYHEALPMQTEDYFIWLYAARVRGGTSTVITAKNGLRKLPVTTV